MHWRKKSEVGTRSARKIISALLRKGFVQDTTHHIYFWLCIDGEETGIRTRLSHGASECDDYLLGRIAGQLKLSRRQLDDLLDCTLDHEALIKILRANGHI